LDKAEFFLKVLFTDYKLHFHRSLSNGGALRIVK
jgi:hypothetical protein